MLAGTSRRRTAMIRTMFSKLFKPKTKHKIINHQLTHVFVCPPRHGTHGKHAGLTGAARPVSVSQQWLVVPWLWVRFSPISPGMLVGARCPTHRTGRELLRLGQAQPGRGHRDGVACAVLGEEGSGRVNREPTIRMSTRMRPHVRHGSMLFKPCRRHLA